MTGYTKLFASIVTSTIWTEDAKTCKAWVTMLALANKHGEVMSSIPGLAQVAGLPLEDTEIAINKFLSPDKYSRTPDDEGRRIEKIDGGWTLLNHAKYRDMANIDEQKEAAARRQSAFRDRQKRNEIVTDSNASSHDVTKSNDIAEAEAEAEAVLNPITLVRSEEPICPVTRKLVTDDAFLAELSRHYPDIDVARELRKIDAWCLANPGKQKTRRRIINWLNRVETPVKTTKQEDSKWTF